MEPVGFLASIATLAETARLMISLLHRFKEAPLQIKRTTERLHVLAVELELVLEAQDFFSENSGAFRKYHLLLQRFHQDMTILSNKLATTVKFGHGRRIRWLLVGNREANELIMDLTQLESTLSLVTNLMQTYEHPEKFFQ